MARHDKPNWVVPRPARLKSNMPCPFFFFFLSSYHFPSLLPRNPEPSPRAAAFSPLVHLPPPSLHTRPMQVAARWGRRGRGACDRCGRRRWRSRRTSYRHDVTCPCHHGPTAAWCAIVSCWASPMVVCAGTSSPEARRVGTAWRGSHLYLSHQH